MQDAVSSGLFEPVAGERISAMIVNQLIDLIRSGKVQPGDRLPPERNLAETLKVDRTTVRDAIRVLETMGLVEVRIGASGGVLVSKPSPDVVGASLLGRLLTERFSVGQLAEVRLVVELSVFDLAVERIDNADLCELEELCQESRDLLDAGRYDKHLARSFHIRLAQAAHNPAVSALVLCFLGPLSMAAVRSGERPEEARRRTVEEHSAIVGHLADRRLDEARFALATHLLRGRVGSTGLERLVHKLI